MARTRGTCLYKEARLNIEPAFPGSTVSFTLPAEDTSTFGTRTHAKRSVVTERHSDQDEKAFAKRHLASDGSMFFRKHHQYPRTFLWRILDDRKTLEIQAVDLDHEPSDHKLEANITLLLHFASPIRPFCVAFSEPEERDALTVFAITNANELYTITLHRDFFMKLAASEQEISDWCKRSSLVQLGLRIPYRLVAESNNQLLVTLDNGGILYLSRKSKDDLAWNEAVYLETSWSVRGWLTWKSDQKVRFGDDDLEASAAAAVAFSPDGGKHILSVCLNHKLRAWNVISGRPGIQMDLLGEPDRPNEKATPYLIGPAQPTLMAVVNIAGGLEGANYHVVTYSPKQHQFKFWGIRDADDADLGIYDMKSDFDFVPPIDDLMDTTAWTLAEFFINPGPAGWRGAELWIRARSGPSSKIFALKFDPTEESGRLANTWRNEWVSVDSGPLSVEQLKQNPANPSEQALEASELYETDLTEKWLDFLFYPGRFTTASLEAALVVFRRGLERGRATNSASRGSLKERICVTIDAFAAQGQSGVVSHDEYQETVSAQWQAFYGLVKDLHKRRGEYLSLVFDYKTDLPWLVLSDYLSAIRQCSDTEVIALNSQALAGSRTLTPPLQRVISKPEAREASRLLNAASTFRRRLPASLQYKLQREVESELLQSRSLSVFDRMELMEANCNLSQQVFDDDLSALVEELGTDVKDLTTETFLRAIQLLAQDEQGRLYPKKEAARFGLNALVRVSQETLEHNTNILLDLLVLILFMQYEDDLSDEFDASEVYVEIILKLKDCAVQTWLASTVWSHPVPTGPSSRLHYESLAETFKNARKKLPVTQTVLEGKWGYRAFDSPMPIGLKAELLTYWSRVWLQQVFAQNQSYESSLEDIMGILLVQEEYGLALEFSKYLPEGNWSSYLKGRMHLALGEYTLASICFKKAAYNLALGMFSIEDADQVQLIPIEQQDDFSEGLPKYYRHVLAHFEKSKAYSFVADFARLGLRSLKGSENEEIKTELLSRLFNASMQTSRFDDAYSAMIRHTDEALRSAALHTLVTTMVHRSEAPALLKLPFVELAADVDAILASLCHQALSLSSGPQYHHILYSYRISRNNFRGAASILYERLQRLKSTSSQIHDPADQSLVQCYLMIINTLASVSKDEAYILAEQRIEAGASNQWGIGQAKKMLKRQVVTLDSLRKEYQAELDRVEAIANGQYPFVEANDEMDIL